METNSNIPNNQSCLPSSSAPVMWHTNFTLEEDGSMVSIPNQEHSATPEALSQHGTYNIEDTLDREEEQECERSSLLEERSWSFLEEVEKRCGNHVAKLLTTTKARSGWNSFISTKRQEELDSAEANQARLAEETMEERIKRYSAVYKEPGVAAQFELVAEKFNLDTGLKGYVSNADMTEKAYEI
ncbi:hypothetical protein INT45_011354 [Circinella minor]|uniref:Uncharacterized protein n=1 Tax=Circinella minor TaxID=1195481 RepID=A0A8H7RH33_9FUNG|nr:hypothetical protein INT45_011354 [Circinella minor]